MKSVKNDTKYIIKRILIGVGIAIILFNLKKCNVYADSNVRTFCNNNNNATSTWTYYDEDINCSHRTYNNSSDSFTYNGYKYNVGWYSSSNSDKPFLLVFEYNNEPYVTYGNIGTIPTGDNWYINIVANQNQNNIWVKKTGESNISFTSGFLPYFSNHYYENGTSTSGGIVYTNLNTDENINFQNIKQLSWSFFMEHYEDLNMIYNTYNLPVYVNSDYEVPVVPDNPLANLTQVDLTGYEGALIVPKSYEVMNEDYSSTQEVAPGVFHTNLNLSFYTQYCTRQTLVNLTNVKNLYTNNIGVSTGSLSASISGTCPTEPTETIMSYQYDMYSGMIPMGILLYNNQINEDGSFGTSYAWYDGDIYDIYMIESLDSFSADISFTDYDGTEKELTIEGLPTFLEMAEYALEHDTDLNKNRTNSLFSFIQAPFSFLNLIKTTKCTALRFPFPNSNQIIIIPCMSETYERIGGNLIYTISIIINGLIIYRCIITMIKVTECMLDADDDKLEVLEL